MLAVIDFKPNRPSYTTIRKLLGCAERDTEIDQERGITLEDVFLHDHHLTSHLFDGNLTSVTPDKIKLVAQLEASSMMLVL